ncbi:MAG: hypothetical protein IT222_02845 [Crocinitomix sp.]|nr:hypothetical protein [Crocinitomix sp.]
MRQNAKLPLLSGVVILLARQLGHELFDFGISLGYQFTFSRNKKLCFMLGLKHTFFPYVYDKGLEFYDIPSSPRNVSTLTLGIGFNFTKKTNQIP